MQRAQPSGWRSSARKNLPGTESRPFRPLPVRPAYRRPGLGGILLSLPPPAGRIPAARAYFPPGAAGRCGAGFSVPKGRGSAVAAKRRTARTAAGLPAAREFRAGNPGSRRTKRYPVRQSARRTAPGRGQTGMRRPDAGAGDSGSGSRPASFPEGGCPGRLRRPCTTPAKRRNPLSGCHQTAYRQPRPRCVSGAQCRGSGRLFAFAAKPARRIPDAGIHSVFQGTGSARVFCRGNAGGCMYAGKSGGAAPHGRNPRQCGGRRRIYSVFRNGIFRRRDGAGRFSAPRRAHYPPGAGFGLRRGGFPVPAGRTAYALRSKRLPRF